jgi:hypothetical protein
MFHLDVLKINRVLHLSPRCLLLFSMLVIFGWRESSWVWVAWVGQVVRAARNLSERGVRHRANEGRGELRPNTGLGPDARALTWPIVISMDNAK